MVFHFPLEAAREAVARALAEDRADSDVTTAACVPTGQMGAARILAKADGVLAGLPVAQLVFEAVDATLCFETLAREGDRVVAGQPLARVSGRLADILRAERTALNFLQRMSGIATETARYVAAVEGTRTRILDTRKTVPGLRPLDKYAVRAGGGQNHRLDLSDGILVKDNHLAAMAARGLGMREAVAQVKRNAPPGMRVQVEVESFEQAQEALAGGADALLLDNMPPAEMRRVAELCASRAPTEASGGISLASARAAAETGVDYISVGALTHSVRALDISLELEKA